MSEVVSPSVAVVQLVWPHTAPCSSCPPPGTLPSAEMSELLSVELLSVAAVLSPVLVVALLVCPSADFVDLIPAC